MIYSFSINRFFIPLKDDNKIFQRGKNRQMRPGLVGCVCGFLPEKLKKGNKKMREIIAFFDNGRRVRFTMAVYSLLVTDICVNEIIDAETGEIMFKR